MAEIITKFSEGEEVIITTQQEQKYRVPFFTALVEEDKIMDELDQGLAVQSAMDQFAKLSKTAGWFFWTLVKERTKLTNMSVFRAKDNIEAQKVTVAYQELHDRKLVKRVKRQHYIINPNAILPLFKEYQTVCGVWNELTYKEKTDDNS